jgi:hypothetical protein
VALDGANGDEEIPGHLRVGLARGEEGKHLEFSLAQGIFEPEGRPVAARQRLPVGFAEGIGRDAFARLLLQVTFASKLFEHLRRFVYGERGPHRGRRGGEFAAFPQDTKKLLLFLPGAVAGTAGRFVRLYGTIYLS